MPALCWVVVLLLNFIPDRPRHAATHLAFAAHPQGPLDSDATAVAGHHHAGGAAALIALILSAAGGQVFEHPEAENTMPLTTVMGNWLGWLTPGLLLSAGVFVFLAWRNDPARPGRPTAHVAGVPDADRRDRRHGNCDRRGWLANFGEPGDERRRPQSSCIRKRPQVHEFDPDWPLAVSRTDLDGEFVYDRMARRDEIQLRRSFLPRAVEKIFHEAKGRAHSGGCGYWLAPHLWFVAGLTRDEVTGGDEEPTFLTEVVGPPYAEVFTLPVRRYVYRLLKALQVDLIFVEDGVGYRKLVRVFRVLFEVYDKGAGQETVRGHSLPGPDQGPRDVPRLRRGRTVPIDQVSGAEVRPVGPSARLHIFRDRGGEEEFVEPPFSVRRQRRPRCWWGCEGKRDCLRQQNLNPWRELQSRLIWTCMP